MKKNNTYIFVLLILLFTSCSDEDQPDLRQLVTIDGINKWTHMRVSMPARFVGNVEVPGYWGLYVVQSRDPNRLVYDGYFIAVKTEIFENDQYPITLSRPENNFYIDKVVGTDDPGGGNLIYFTGPTTTLTIEAIKDGKIWASFSGVDEDGYYTTEGKIEGLPMSDFEISY